MQERSATPSAMLASGKRLATLTDSLATFADRAHEIMTILSARNLNSTSNMYMVEMAPTVRSEAWVSLRTIALAGFGLWAAVMAVVAMRGMFFDRRQQMRGLARLGGPHGAPLADHVAANVGAVADLSDRRPAPRRLAGEVR